MPAERPFVLITGSANRPLANDIGNILGEEVYTYIDPEQPRFPNGEVRITSLPITLRKRDVFIIQPTCFPDVNGTLMELLLMVQAAKLNSAQEVTAVVPFFAYARQDRKSERRIAISAKLVSDMIKAAGAKRIVTMDIHAEQEEGFFDGPWDNTYASPVLLPEIRALNLRNLSIGTADVGGTKRGGAYADLLETNLVIAVKERVHSKNDTVRIKEIIGDVKGRDIAIVDDIISTAGTNYDATDAYLERGANSVTWVATHGELVGKAIDRITRSPVERVIVTDTICPRPEVQGHPKIKIVPVGQLLADTIHCVHFGKSLTDNLVNPLPLPAFLR